MKAIRVQEFGPPEVMRIVEMPDLRPGPSQLVLRVKAAGVNPVDAYVRTGTYARKPVLPYTPGSDAAGVVESIGKSVSRAKVGERVYTSGTITGAYAEQALCEEHRVHRLPDNISFSQGAAVNVPYATAYRALFQRAKAKPGQTILVHGATGGVGVAAVQLAVSAGMKVIGTGGSEKGRRLLVELGANEVLDHRAPDHAARLAALGQGAGVDVVLEMLANVNLGLDLKALAPDGRVVVIGSRGPVEINPRDAMSRDGSIVGMLLFNASDEELVSIYAALGAGLANGTLKPVVGKELPLAEAPRAHHEIMEGTAYGKIVLIP